MAHLLCLYRTDGTLPIGTQEGRRKNRAQLSAKNNSDRGRWITSDCKDVAFYDTGIYWRQVAYYMRHVSQEVFMSGTSRPMQFEERAQEALPQIVKLLGGRAVWKKAPTNKLQVHESIRKGFPGKVLVHVSHTVTEIPSDKLFEVVGISQRTMQRRAENPEKPLSQDQSSRLWKFAEILNTATEVFGDRESAARWLTSPAIALEQRAPVDLMTTQPGAELVEQLLGRLEHGVYT